MVSRDMSFLKDGFSTSSFKKSQLNKNKITETTEKINQPLPTLITTPIPQPIQPILSKTPIIEQPPKYELMVIDQPTTPTAKTKKEKKAKKDPFIYVDFEREPLVTFCVTPNNAPVEKGGNRRSYFSDDSDDGYSSYMPSYGKSNMTGGKNSKQEKGTNMILNTIHGLYESFYLPHRVRFHKKGIKIKLNDIVSYKIAIEDQILKFYISIPKRWSRNFIASMKHEWGEIDIVEVENKIMDFNAEKTKAMEVQLKYHYGLSLKHTDHEDDIFMQSIASLASTFDKDEKLLIDFNIEPANDDWKINAAKTISNYKQSLPITKDFSFSVRGVWAKANDALYIIGEEFKNMVEATFQPEGAKEEKAKANEKKDLQYSEKKIQASAKGFKVQIRILGESSNNKKLDHALKSLQTSFNSLEGENRFIFLRPKKKATVQKLIEGVENNKPIPRNPTNILFDKELKNLVKIPSKETLQEFRKIIMQDNFTRTEIDDVFTETSDGAIPFSRTLDKEPKLLHMPGYERADWSEKGRLARNVQALDWRMIPLLIFGKQGSGKTTMAINQILYTFGAHIKDKDEWKKMSKSVVAFDVADGEMIQKIYNALPDFQKERTIILNHGNHAHPIAVNNADLEEYNSEVLNDKDYAFVLAEMESNLLLEAVEMDGKPIAMSRWFSAALQAAHMLDKDFGYIEAMRILTDTIFRNTVVIPKLQKLKNKRLLRDIETFDKMAAEGKAGADTIINTIQNRFSELERDQKLWNNIAQRPVRDENGKVKLNFRKMMDGDEDGAYLILIHIPKSGISSNHRRFLFAHYFTKIWNVLLSREGGSSREYRPETLIAVDEIHQIIDIPIISKLFVDLFKEPRKYSGRYLFTLHGWSSIAKAGKGREGDIKQSILDNGCNLAMLKGGGDAFKSLSDFLAPMTMADFLTLTNMKNCGIFSVNWNNKNNVFQAEMITAADKKGSDFKQYSNYNSSFITDFQSPYGREKEEVEDDNFERGDAIYKSMLESELSGDVTSQVESVEKKPTSESEDEFWNQMREIGLKDKKLRG